MLGTLDSENQPIDNLSFNKGNYVDAAQIGTPDGCCDDMLKNSILMHYSQSPVPDPKNPIPEMRTNDYSFDTNKYPVQLMLSNNFNQQDAFLQEINAYMDLRYWYQNIIDSKSNNPYDPIIGTYGDQKEPIHISEAMLRMTRVIDENSALTPYVQFNTIDENHPSSFAGINDLWTLANIGIGFIPGIGPWAAAASSLAELGVNDFYFNKLRGNAGDANYNNQCRINYLCNALDMIYTNSMIGNDAHVSGGGVARPFKIVNYQISLDNWSASMDWQNHYEKHGLNNHSVGIGFTQLNFGGVKLNIKLDIEYN